MNGLSSLTSTQKRGITALGIGLTAVGAAAAIGVAASRRKKKRTASAKRARKAHNRSTKGRRTPRTAGKGKDRSTRRIRYTKNGQPYVLLRSGKARFIKKNSAKNSHRRKGGRY